MKVSVAGIYDRGILDKERVHFRADTDLDLSFFVLLDTQSVGPTQVSAGNLSAYWFAPRAIPRGHHLVVYTRTGNSNSEPGKTEPSFISCFAVYQTLYTRYRKQAL